MSRSRHERRGPCRRRVPLRPAAHSGATARPYCLTLDFSRADLRCSCRSKISSPPPRSTRCASWRAGQPRRKARGGEWAAGLEHQRIFQCADAGPGARRRAAGGCARRPGRHFREISSHTERNTLPREAYAVQIANPGCRARVPGEYLCLTEEVWCRLSALAHAALTQTIPLLGEGLHRWWPLPRAACYGSADPGIPWGRPFTDGQPGRRRPRSAVPPCPSVAGTQASSGSAYRGGSLSNSARWSRTPVRWSPPRGPGAAAHASAGSLAPRAP